MQKIVLDTNCLLQALPLKSPYHRIWKLVLDGEISLCVNTEILEEYGEIISAKTNAEIGKNVVEAIVHLSTTVFQNTYVHFGLIEDDVDDNKFVDCAIAADAKCIVSNDSHFKVLDTISWPKVVVVNIKEFCKTLPYNYKDPQTS